MKIKQLLLIFFLFAFSAEAMEEIKVANENIVKKNDRIAQLEKLNKYVPNTVKFLLQTLRKKNVTDEVIKEIILFLRTDAFHMYVSQGLVDFWGKKWITHGIYIPYGRNIVSQYGSGYFSLSELLKNIHEHDSFNKLSSYSLLIDGWRGFSESADFELTLKKSKEISDLDIDKCNIRESNKIYKIASWEEIKVANENIVKKNDRIAQLEKLNKYVPNTVKFLLQTLRKKNFTDEVIKEIILFLRTDAFHIYVSQGLVDFWGKKWITHGIYIPYGRNIVSQYGSGYFSLSELLKNIHEHDSFNKLSSYSLLIDGWRGFSESADFELTLKKSKEISDLDIDKCNIRESNKIYKIASWIRNHKLQSLAAVSAVAGILRYAAKKLRK